MRQGLILSVWSPRHTDGALMGSIFPFSAVRLEVFAGVDASTQIEHVPCSLEERDVPGRRAAHSSRVTSSFLELIGINSSS